jgi:hypothetical protein
MALSDQITSFMTIPKSIILFSRVIIGDCRFGFFESISSSLTEVEGLILGKKLEGIPNDLTGGYLEEMVLVLEQEGATE